MTSDSHTSQSAFSSWEAVRATPDIFLGKADAGISAEHPDEMLLASLEAILMVTESPISVGELADCLGYEDSVVEVALRHLMADYSGKLPGHRMRGFELREVAGGWRIYANPQFADSVSRYVIGNAHSKLSQAALETLAVVAYRQPVSRSRISHIRGVNVDAVVRTLVARGLIEEVGENPSGARLYGTTTYFLERMGFDSLDDLVPLAPYLPQSDELDELEELL